jgi:hypothetical protein
MFIEKIPSLTVIIIIGSFTVIGKSFLQRCILIETSALNYS